MTAKETNTNCQPSEPAMDASVDSAERIAECTAANRLIIVCAAVNRRPVVWAACPSRQLVCSRDCLGRSLFAAEHDRTGPARPWLPRWARHAAPHTGHDAHVLPAPFPSSNESPFSAGEQSWPAV